MKSDNQIIVLCKQPIKITKPVVVAVFLQHQWKKYSSDCFVVIFLFSVFVFSVPSKVMIIGKQFMFMGISIFWALLRAHFNPRLTAAVKMSLSRPENVFMSPNINSIALFWCHLKSTALEAEMGELGGHVWTEEGESWQCPRNPKIPQVCENKTNPSIAWNWCIIGIIEVKNFWHPLDLPSLPRLWKLFIFWHADVIVWSSEMQMIQRLGYLRKTRHYPHRTMAEIWPVYRHCRESMKFWSEIWLP